MLVHSSLSYCVNAKCYFFSNKDAHHRDRVKRLVTSKHHSWSHTRHQIEPVYQHRIVLVFSSKGIGKTHSRGAGTISQHIMFYAVRVRPDILCTVNFLSTRTRLETANTDDKKKLIQLVQFITSVASEGIILGGDTNHKLRIFICTDASYGVHMDGELHTGLVISLGTGPIFVKSGKQKCVTKSSFQAEILAQSDILTTVLWVRDLVVELLGHQKPPLLLEDNKAAIQLVTNGSSTADRSKHVHIRNNFVYQFLNRGEMEIRHCPTSKMVTDLLTQPLPTHTFSILREILSKKTSGTGVSQKSSNT